MAFDPSDKYTIVGEIASKSKSKIYAVRCDICAQDSELNGLGLFKSSIGNLKNGQCPCLCAINALKSKEQWEVLYKRALKKLGLEFLGWSMFNNSRSKALFKCSKCYSDPELYGEGLFETGDYGSLCKGQIYCGCFNGYVHNKEQMLIKLKRLLKDKPYIIREDLIPENVRTTSRISLECMVHGVFEKSLHNVLYNESGCQKCAKETVSKRMKGKAPIAAIDSQRKTEEYFISKFLNTNCFPNGTVFTKINSTKWNVYCSVCDVTNECWTSSLERGILSCKCMKGIRYTKAERDDQLRELAEQRSFRFVGWKEEDKQGAHDKIVIFCKIHGEFYPSVTNFLRGRGCPNCSNKNQKQCYINILYDKDIPVAIKFGIAKDSIVRTNKQNKNSVYRVENFGIWEFENVYSCKEAERICKMSLECGVITKQEMLDGYSETTYVYNLDKIVNIYEQSGGISRYCNY